MTSIDAKLPPSILNTRAMKEYRSKRDSLKSFGTNIDKHGARYLYDKLAENRGMQLQYTSVVKDIEQNLAKQKVLIAKLKLSLGINSAFLVEKEKADLVASLEEYLTKSFNEVQEGINNYNNHMKEAEKELIEKRAMLKKATDETLELKAKIDEAKKEKMKRKLVVPPHKFFDLKSDNSVTQRFSTEGELKAKANAVLRSRFYVPSDSQNISLTDRSNQRSSSVSSVLKLATITNHKEEKIHKVRKIYSTQQPHTDLPTQVSTVLADLDKSAAATYDVAFELREMQKTNELKRKELLRVCAEEAELIIIAKDCFNILEKALFKQQTKTRDSKKGLSRSMIFIMLEQKRVDDFMTRKVTKSQVEEFAEVGRRVNRLLEENVDSEELATKMIKKMVRECSPYRKQANAEKIVQTMSKDRIRQLDPIQILGLLVIHKEIWAELLRPLEEKAHTLGAFRTHLKAELANLEKKKEATTHQRPVSLIAALENQSKLRKLPVRSSSVTRIRSLGS